MKTKIMTVLAMVIAGVAMAAQNDPLFAAVVAVGESCSLIYNASGEAIAAYTNNSTTARNVSFQGKAALSRNVADYSLVKASALAEDPNEPNEEPAGETPIDTFSVEAVNYLDNQAILDGERFVFVQVAEGKTFGGFNYDGTLVDSENNKVALLGTALNGGLVETTMPTVDEGYDGFVYVLDSRSACGGAELTPDENRFIRAWAKLDLEGVIAPEWTKLQLAEQNLDLDYDPADCVAPGYAAVYNQKDDGKYTIAKAPTAYTSILDDTFKFGGAEGVSCGILNDPGNLQFPIVAEVMYQFDAFPQSLSDYREFFWQKNNADALYALIRGYRAQINANKKAYIMGSDFANYLSQIDSEQQADALSWIDTVAPYFEWNCDFTISFDKPIKANSYVLAGCYERATEYVSHKWILACYPYDLEARQEIRLLKDGYSKSVYVNYAEICTRVQQFLCGVKNLSPENYGTTMTVKLNIYDNYGNDNESGKMATVGVYRYLFRGPLNVKFHAGDDAPDGAVMPADWECESYTYDATLPKPNYHSDDIMFAGWTNALGQAFSAVPAYTYADVEHPLEFWATWKKAKTVEVLKGLEKDVEIKVAEDKIIELVGEADKDDEEKIKEELNRIDEGNGLAVWQNYVLGIEDTSDPSAKVKIESSAESDTESIQVTSTIVTSNLVADTGFKVTYSLDKVEEDAKTVDVEGAESDSKDLKIALDTEANPTGYYKMNVIITSEAETDQKVKIASENTVGVLKVENTDKLAIVSVPWTDINGETTSEDEKPAIKATEIINTASLDDNAVLHVYNKSEGIYKDYVYENGAWKGTRSYTLDENGQQQDNGTPTDDDAVVSRGDGVWLERPDTSKPFYLYGKYETNTVATTQIEAPAESEADAVYNLVAPPAITDTDLNEVAALNDSAQVNENDVIATVGGGIPTKYTYKEGEGWGYMKSTLKTIGGKQFIKKVRVTDDAKIPAGSGFWYVSQGGSPTIEWDKKK